MRVNLSDRILVAMLVGLVLAACQGDPGDVIGACDTRAKDGLCRVWSGRDKGDYEPYCTFQLDGSYAAGEGCPAPDQVGSCYADLPGQYVTVYFYRPSWGDFNTSPEGYCSANLQGVFSPP